jgi:Family of unknown function (DUF6526)
MESQNYASHRQLVPMYHFVLFLLLLLTLIGAGVNLYQSWGDHQRLYSASLILVLTLGVLILFFLARIFALKAQDRAIRAEESLRHFVLTGKLLDSRLGVRQIVALRFASDAEFPPLARDAAEKSMAPKAIKQAIKSWRGDFYRV